MNLPSRLGGLRDGVRTKLWPLPTAAVIVAMVGGVAVPRLDARVDSSLPAFLADVLFQGNPSGARTVLDAIASSMITVTSLTFSLTVVTLQLASSQFSPRLLRTFTRDLFVQSTLALFLATFTYSLTVLRGIRTDSTNTPFVPSIAVSFGFLLALASVIGLVLFLAHLANEIRVETMLRTVHSDASATLRNRLPHQHDAAGRISGAMPEPGGAVAPVLASRSGFVVRIDEAALIAAATGFGGCLVIDVFPGASVVAGTPIGAAWHRDGHPLTPDEETSLRTRLVPAIEIGHERTSEQDIGYGIRQLTDVAVRALSPGVNDPTTAVHALGHAAALIGDLSERELGPVIIRDENSRAAVLVARPAFADLLDIAVAQPRRYGAAEPAVVERLLIMLREIAWRSLPAHRDAVAEQLERLRPCLTSTEFDRIEQARLRACADLVSAALSGQWKCASPTSVVLEGSAAHRDGPFSGDRSARLP